MKSITVLYTRSPVEPLALRAPAAFSQGNGHHLRAATASPLDFTSETLPNHRIVRAATRWRSPALPETQRRPAEANSIAEAMPHRKAA